MTQSELQTSLDYEIGLNVYSPLVDLACEAVPHALHSDCLQCLLEVLIRVAELLNPPLGDSWRPAGIGNGGDSATAAEYQERRNYFIFWTISRALVTC